MNPRNEFLKLFKSISYKHTPYTLFSDFVTMSAISMHNAIVRDETLESEYLQMAGKYDKQELETICALFACVVEGLEVPQDFLGAVFMELEISNAGSGQFFTPYEVSKMMAKMLTPKDEILKKADSSEFLTLSEPACGAGGQVIAFAESMREAGINYQQRLWVQAVDIDRTCAMMTYLQLSLLSIPAEVITGNTLTLEVSRTMRTPAHYLGCWDVKLKNRAFENEANNIIANSQKQSKSILIEKEQDDFFSPLVLEQSAFDF